MFGHGFPICTDKQVIKNHLVTDADTELVMENAGCEEQLSIDKVNMNELMHSNVEVHVTTIDVPSMDVLDLESFQEEEIEATIKLMHVDKHEKDTMGLGMMLF